MNSIKFLSKITLAASFSLALAFIISCSSDDNKGDGGSLVTGGADGGGNQFSQIYIKHYDMENNVSPIGEAYEGSGVIEIEVWDEAYKKIIDNINAGSVTDGIVKLELPKTIPDKYLINVSSLQGCPNSYKDIKIFVGEFALTDNNGKIGRLEIEDGYAREGIGYYYFSKAGKITCNSSRDDNLNIDAKEGWNKIYWRYNQTGMYSTENILTKEVKWVLKE